MTGQPIQILLLEDNPGDARLLQRIFAADRTTRTEIICADRLSKALAQLSARAIDAVLLDLSLPDSTGLDSLKQVRTHAPNIPIVLLTGLDDEKNALEAMRLGAQDYLVKGRVDGEVLIRTMRYAIERKRAESALRQAEENYRGIFENAIEGIFQSSPQGRFTSVNSAMARILGYASPDEVVTRITSIRDQFYANPGRRTTAIQQLEQKGTLENYESECLRKDGSRIWISENARAVRDATGTLLYYEGFIQDITERKRAEEALRESEERYRLITARVDDIVWQLDLSLHFVYISPAVERVLGYSLQEARGLYAADLLDEDGSVQMREVVQNRAERKSDFNMPTEFRMRHKDGHWVDVEVLASALFDAEGRPTGFVGVTRDITERKRAEEEIRQRNQELATLNQIGQSLNKLATPAKICETIFTMAGHVLDNRNLFVALYDEPSQQISFPVYTMNGERRNIAGRLFGNGLTEYVIRTNAPLLVTRDLPRGMAERGIDLLGEPARSFLAVPMRAGEKIIGVIALQDYEKDDVYNEHHLELLTTIAAQAATALENARLFANTQRRTDELAALNRVATAVSQSLNLDDVLNAALDELTHTLHLPKAWVYLLEPNTATLVVRAERGWSKTIDDHDLLRLGEGLSGNVAQDGQPRTLNIEDSDLATRDKLLAIGYRAIAAVPLLSEAGILGVLGVASEKRDRFGETEVGWLSAVGNTITVALKNARLFAETQRHTGELAALNQIGQALSKLAPPSEIFEMIFAAIGQILDNQNFFIALYDEVNQQISFPVYTINGERVARAARPFANGSTEYVIRTKAPLFLPRNAHAARLERGIASTGKSCQCFLSVPLLVGENVLGVIALQDYEKENVYDEHHLELLTTIAAQAAAALANARLFEEQQASLAMTTRLYELSAQVLTAPTIEETAHLVIKTVRAGFSADACTIHLFDETGAAPFRLSVGFSPNFHEEARGRPHGLTARVRESKEPIIATGDELHPRVRAEGIQTNIALPLPGEQENIGALFVGYRQPRQFSERERNLLSLFANHAALALRRARLFHQAEQRLTELEAVNKVSTALRAATTLDEMFPVLLDELLNVLHADSGILSLFDPERGELHRVIARGWLASRPALPIQPNEGVAGHVFSTGKPHVAREFISDPLIVEPARSTLRTGWGGACVPIRSTTEVIGILFVAVPLPREISQEELHLLTTLAEIAGNAIQRARLHTQTEQQLQRLTALRTIDNAINASLDLRVTLNVVLGQIVAQLGVDAAAVLLLNPHTQTLEHTASRGFRNLRLEKMPLRLNECLAGRIALERRTHFTTDLLNEDANSARAALLSDEGFITYYGVPLIAKGAVKGVLEIFHRAPLAPNAEWVDFLEALGGQVAIAIDNAGLFDSLQRTNSELVMAYDATIEGWSHALDLRDHETEGHTQRVTELTMRLARLMGIEETHLIHIRRGALLHDIGKVGIPDSILLKPGALTPTEWEGMRQHPVYARDLLAPIAYLRLAMDIPYCHHEKWDGTGYPRGLRGEEIPLAARVFAVIDVWDALLSNRPYRPAWKMENVREHIRAQSGIHFDPRVVEIFLEMQNSE